MMATAYNGVFDVDAFLVTVSEGISVISPSKGQAVFSQGAPADALFYIQKGKIKITTVSRHGKEAVVAILGAGDFFGEGCLTGQPRRISTATAMVDCSISRLDKATVIRVPSMTSLISQNASWPICWRAIVEWRRTSLISFSTLAKNDSPGSFYFSPISERKMRRSRWWRTSVTKLSLR